MTTFEVGDKVWCQDPSEPFPGDGDSIYTVRKVNELLRTILLNEVEGGWYMIRFVKVTAGSTLLITELD